MARILVVCDKSLRIEACRNELAKIRNELGKGSEPEDVEVFLLVARFGGSPLHRLGLERRFWRRAHARLDAALEELAGLEIIGDGIATKTDALDALGSIPADFEPTDVVVVYTGDDGAYRERLGRALAAHAPDAQPPSEIRWLSR